MTEANPGLDLEQARPRRRFGSLGGDADFRCGREDYGRVTNWFGSRYHEQASGVVWERAEAPPETLLYLGGN